MRVLFASAEVTPYSKTGGLADVAGALPLALAPHVDEISVISPLYADVIKKSFDLSPTGITGDILMGKDRLSYAIHKDAGGDKKVSFLFIENTEFFGRDGIYTTPDGEGFVDNNRRFFFYQLVILDLLKKQLIPADILHCNDHHTGLLPGLLKFNNLSIATIFTIHNFLYHGHFGAEDTPLLPVGFADTLNKTQWNNHSALLSGIDEADLVNTVSPGYAEELLKGIDLDSNSFAHVLAAADKFSGIVNGIDTKEWNPEHDPLIPHSYSFNDTAAKRLNKAALLSQFHLDTDLDRPLFGSVSRLVENKGFPLIIEVVDEMVKLGACFVFLGSGDPKIATRLTELATRYPGSVAFHQGYSEALAHLIEAASDVFLMPSRFEPCGLNQLYSLRYGTLPLVNQTGGLSDTVSEVQMSSGTGFVMASYDINELRSAMHRAINLYQLHDEWQNAMRRGMTQDWSWDKSAKEYLYLYQRLERGHNETS